MPIEIRFCGDTVSIQTRKMLHDYFDFQQIYRLVWKDSYQYRQTIQRFRLDCLLDDAMLGDAQSPGFLALLASPEKFLERGREWGAETEGGLVRIQPDVFAQQCGLYFQDTLDAAGRNGEALCTDFVPQAHRDSLRTLAERLTNGGTRFLSPGKAMRFALFFYLHAQACVPEFQEDDIVFIERELSGERYDTGGIIRFFDQSVLVLPFFHGADTLPGRLEVVRIERDPDEGGPRREPPWKTITLEGTAQRRSLLPNAAIYALRVGGQYAGFLPRFCQSGSLISFPRSGKLYHMADEKSFFVPISGLMSRPVSWAHSNEYGSLIADDRGALDFSLPHKTPPPLNRRVVRVGAAGSDYGILFEDGNGEFGVKKRGWNSLLDFSLSLNAGIAINSRRALVGEDGREIISGGAVSCDCTERHYVWTDADGIAHTDTGLERVADTRCRAAAACEKGFLLSRAGGEGRIDWYDFQGRQLGKFVLCESEIDEFSADERTVAWFNNRDGIIRHFTLE